MRYPNGHSRRPFKWEEPEKPAITEAMPYVEDRIIKNPNEPAPLESGQSPASIPPEAFDKIGVIPPPPFLEYLREKYATMKKVPI